MANVTKLNGTVTSTCKAGGTYSATVTFPNPSPPPDNFTVTFNCTESYYNTFLTDLGAGNKVDVIYDDTSNIPSSVISHK